MSAKPNPVVMAISKLIGKLRADDDMMAVLMAFSSLEPDALEKLDPATARTNPTIADAVNLLLQQQGRSSVAADLVPGVTSEDIVLPEPAGGLAARVYTPSGSGPFGLIVYFHGGGWVLADKEVYDGGARGLAKAANAIVVSVDYRLAPEHRFPAAWDDAFAAYRWAVGPNALSAKTTGLVALAGESAGGNLAVATAVAARDAGLPSPAHVLAVYPVTQTGMETESYLENALAVPLNRAMMGWFFDHLTREKADLRDTRLQLIDANLAGLAPTTIITARIDPLRSDGSKLAAALRAAKVPVELRDFDGVTHEFFGTAAVVEKAREAQAYAGQRLAQSFTIGV